MIGVLHTARINTIEFIVSSDKLIKMVNFKLGNEMSAPVLFRWESTLGRKCSMVTWHPLVCMQVGHK